MWVYKNPFKMMSKFPLNVHSSGKHQIINKKEYDRLLKIAYKTIDKSIIAN